MAINFSPFQFPTMREFKKPTNIAEALKEAQPLVTSTLNDVKAYKEQQDRRKMVNDALEGDKAGYEWFNAEDPAHKAVIDEYIRTGSTAGLQGQRNQWLASQERIQQEIKNKEAIQANNDKIAAEKAAADKLAADNQDYANRFEEAKYNLGLKLASIEGNKDPNFDKVAETQKLVDELVSQGFKKSDVYSYLNTLQQQKAFIGEATAAQTTPKKPKAPEAPKPRLTIKK